MDPPAASFVTEDGRGHSAPSESIPLLRRAEASPTNRRGLITTVTSIPMTCARWRPLCEQSARHGQGMACNRTAGAIALGAYPLSYPQAASSSSHLPCLCLSEGFFLVSIQEAVPFCGDSV